MLKNISADEACDMLESLQTPDVCETVSLPDALRRVAFKDFYAKIPIPPFDRSPFDGYAFRGKDTLGADAQNPAVLEILEEIPAGYAPRHDISPGKAAKILTGAPIPNGADATVKYEHTKFTDTHVSIFHEIQPNSDVIRSGSDVMTGDLIARKGALITAPLIASMANQGFANVSVYKKPVITIISTGSELREVGQDAKLPPASIYNSNVYTLMSYLADVGAAPVNGGTVADSPDLIANKLRDALENSDMVITTGGASVGDYDFALKSAQMLGARVLFWKVLLKPGGSMMAAVSGEKIILSLSGSPGAAVVGLLRIAMPYIKKLCGRVDRRFDEIKIRLGDPFMKLSHGKQRILLGRLMITESEIYFESVGQGSEKISAFARCDLLGELPLSAKPLPAGTMIKAYRI